MVDPAGNADSKLVELKKVCLEKKYNIFVFVCINAYILLSVSKWPLVFWLKMLIDWINDVLADHRIIVKDLQEDLYDGLILQKLIGKYAC